LVSFRQAGDHAPPLDRNRSVRTLLIALAFVTATFGAAAPATATEVISGPYTGVVTDVIDGDTLEVRVMVWLGQEVVTRVRIDGIDTPEKRGKCQREKDMAEQARVMTEQMLTDAQVALYDIQHDKYGGRVRARVVTRSGEDIGQMLIKSGLALSYKGEARQPWCSVAQLP
jgi:micrococcal nuclease